MTFPALNTFVTLSPAPGFGPWLKRVADNPAAAGLKGLDASTSALLRTPDWHAGSRPHESGCARSSSALQPSRTPCVRKARAESHSIQLPGSISATAPAWSG